MHRGWFIVGLGALAAVIALVGVNFARNPVEARGAYVDVMLAEIEPAPYGIRSEEGMAPAELVDAVSGR
ncbi:MAG: hypothetical protein GY851_36990, partial [bacterium]|nr:hypothetical protein [bacterium]